MKPPASLARASGSKLWNQNQLAERRRRTQPTRAAAAPHRASSWAGSGTGTKLRIRFPAFVETTGVKPGAKVPATVKDPALNPLIDA